MSVNSFIATGAVLPFPISPGGFYFPQRKENANEPVTELVKYKSTLMVKTYFIDLAGIYDIGFQPNRST